MSRGDLPPPPPYSSSGGTTPTSLPGVVDQMHQQMIQSPNMSMSNHLPSVVHQGGGLQSLSSLYHGVHGSGGDSPNVSSPSSLPPMSSFIHHRSGQHQLSSVVHSLPTIIPPPSPHLSDHRQQQQQQQSQQQHITNMSNNTSDHYTSTIVSISSPNSSSINNNNNQPHYSVSSVVDGMGGHHIGPHHVIQDGRCPNVTAGWSSNNSPTHINHQHMYPGPPSHHQPSNLVEVRFTVDRLFLFSSHHFNVQNRKHVKLFVLHTLV